MREVKIRGYAVEEMVGSQWVYGTGIHVTVFTDKYAKETGVKEECFVWTDSGWVEVHKDSIGQFTGLYDKNGVEIYEGNVLECHHNTLGKVFFHNGAFRLSSDQCELALDNVNSYDDLNDYLIQDHNLVVCGNIYENPELLGVPQ